MNSAIRMFALLVAITGLAAASYAPATAQPLAKLAPITISGPGSQDLPAPPPCMADGTCLVQMASNR
jgi:uncharacterized protein YggE